MTPRSRASFVGLSLEHTTADMARAIMEGVTYSLLDSVELFRRLGVEAEEVLCFAEGAKSTLWRQIIAEVFGVPVHWHRFSDYAATGAARTGARAIGMRLPARELDATWIDTRRPHGNLAERYGRGYKTFKHLYRQLSPLFDELVSARE